MINGDDSVQVKFECKEVDPCENSRAVHISPHNSGNVIDSEKSSINAIRKVDHDLSNEPSTKVVRYA